MISSVPHLFSRLLILSVLLVQLLVSSLWLLHVHARDQSYRISSIHSNLLLGSNQCTEVTVTELITFEFTAGQLQHSVGRYFPRTPLSKTLPIISNYRIYSPSAYISNAYLRDDKSRSGRYLTWDFVLLNSSVPEQVVTLELTFTIDDIFKHGGPSSQHMTLFYSYKWDAPVDHISANISFHGTVRNSSTIHEEMSWTPRSDGRCEVTSNGVRASFLQDSSLPTNEHYDITVSVPGEMGWNWANLYFKKTRNVKMGVIVGCSIAGLYVGVIVAALVALAWFKLDEYRKKNSLNNRGSTTRCESTYRSCDSV